MLAPTGIPGGSPDAVAAEEGLLDDPGADEASGPGGADQLLLRPPLLHLAVVGGLANRRHSESVFDDQGGRSICGC